MSRGLVTCLLVTLWVAATQVAGSAEIEAFVRLIEEAETPAKEAGVLVNVVAKEGQIVTEGQLLAQIEDAQARFNRKRAELEVQLAKEEAENDVLVRAAEKAAAVAHNEWQRAQHVVKTNPNAISESEVEHRRLVAEKADLDVERAQRDLRMAKVNLAVKQNELQFAEEKLQRHQVTAPVGGMVVEVHKRQGEWVEPGDQVMRLVRIDRLRAEGFADAHRVRSNWVGAPIALTVRLGDGAVEQFSGKIVFVSPEIDPVNGQVAVWGEVANRNMLLRPGLRATIVIDESNAAGASKP